VIARAPNRVGVTVATLDLGYLKQIRRELPAMEHRRHDLLPTGKNIKANIQCRTPNTQS
jgi:predicted amidohydrolase